MPIALKWLHKNLFYTWYNTIFSLISLYIVLWAAEAFFSWALVGAVWRGEPADCRAASGACWAIVHEKYRLILFGRYPYEQHWRPLLATGMLIAALVTSAARILSVKQLLLLWAVVLSGYAALMWGGVFGLNFVPTQHWGGLPLTVMLASFGLMGAFPLAVFLALARQSKMPIMRGMAVTYIELVRGVPLISVLFMASVMFPLFLPEGFSINQLLRAQLGFVLFAAAYLAEVIRGGLQSLPRGQYEAADALGLSYWQKMGLIILPQALSRVIPPMVNTFIGAFKDTSLVVIIGLLDLLLAARTAIADAPWRPFFVEVYVFIALIYFVFCYSISRYSRYLEKQVARGL